MKAWNEYRESGNSNISFENWLGLDYIEPLTLLEAAKAAIRWMVGHATPGCRVCAFGVPKAVHGRQ